MDWNNSSHVSKLIQVLQKYLANMITYSFSKAMLTSDSDIPVKIAWKYIVTLNINLHVSKWTDVSVSMSGKGYDSLLRVGDEC